ncbi:Ig-like domain-containing protein [Bacillus dakarensis]|uniref:Ig-like domain-containing protein n=1 Tax=Robertmurraya dakarensis TaxID=1926278 RepID=UPI0009815146|nr:Ig-like domain-containing protein [Bacillus dakarensis]
MKKIVSLFFVFFLMFGTPSAVHAEENQQFAIQPKFDAVSVDYNEGLAFVYVHGKWGFIANPLNVSDEIKYPLEGYKDKGTRTNIAADKTWKIEFNDQLLDETVNSQAIRVLDQNGEVVKVEFDITDDGKSVLVSPSDTLYETGKTYYLLVGNSIRSEEGKELKEAVSIKFTIQ